MFYFLYFHYFYHSSYTVISIIKDTSDLDFAAFEAAWSERAWDESWKVCTSVSHGQCLIHAGKKTE